jgi:hypothetical protein
MALTYGQKWAIYSLMATHTTTAKENGKSKLRVAFEKAAGAKPDWSEDLRQTANHQLGLNLQPGSLLPLPPTSTSDELRTSLGFTAAEYDPTMGPCPGTTSIIGTTKTSDHQLAIARALLGMTGGV